MSRDHEGAECELNWRACPNLSTRGGRPGQRQYTELLQELDVIGVHSAVNRFAVLYFCNAARLNNNALIGGCDSNIAASVRACRAHASDHRITARDYLL